MVQIVINEAEINWKAAIWWLERAARGRWGSSIESEARPITNPQRLIIEIIEEGA